MVVTAYMVDYVQVNRTLQTLNLKSNELGTKGAVPLSEALKVRQTTHLHMSLHHFSLLCPNNPDPKNPNLGSCNSQ